VAATCWCWPTLRTGHGVAANSSEVTLHQAEDFFPRVVSSDQTRYWWYVEGHLYEIYLQDIYFGAAAENRVLGYLALGYEVDDRVTREVSRVAASEVAFRYGNAVVRSTLTASQESQLQHSQMNLPVGEESLPMRCGWETSVS